MVIIKRILQLFSFLLILVSLYLLIAFIFAKLPTQSSIQNPTEELYICRDENVLSHTEIIISLFPLKEVFLPVFPKLLRNNPLGYIAFSYGDRDFMMDKKGFSKLNITLAMRALFINTPALIKVGHYGSFNKAHCQSVKVDKKGLLYLSHAILESFQKKESRVIRYHDIYGRDYIYYYLAKAPYNLFHTCNSWSGEVLREAGLKMPLWTPLAENITSQVN